MLLAVFVFSGLIFVLELVTSVECVCHEDKIICRCGISDNTFSISCIDDNPDENPCEIYESCETCENNVAHCLTCPRGYFGPFCDQEQDPGTWQDSPDASGKGDTTGRLVSRDLSCPELRSPKLGSISCWYRGYEKECTGRCLPGHNFENNNKEIKLVCESGVWTPYSSFPPCLSEGYCKFDLFGGGFYNCTIGGRGTYCDIICHGQGYKAVSGRFYCYPGSSWDPPLPFCAKESGAERDRPPPCECQNGGSCNSRNRQCTCPTGYQGRLCEIKEYDTRSRCPHPEKINNGEVKNSDASTVAQNQQFYEGSSVVFSCHSEFALVGESLLTCTKYGTWSNSVPQCKSLQEPKSGPRPNTLRICSDPGQVTNGVRRNMNKQRTARSQPFVKGSSVMFVCNDGFYLSGESMLTCTSSGKWSSSLPKCKRIESPSTESTTDDLVYCDDPGVDPNGIKTVSLWIDAKSKKPDDEEPEYPQGTKLYYSCKDGYNLQGENSLLCLFSGRWSSPIPKCHPKPAPVIRAEEGYCENPGEIRNGRKITLPFVDPRTRKNVVEDSADLPQGVKVVYSCATGFAIRGSNIIECTSTGSWSSATPTCEKHQFQGCGHSYYAMTGKIHNGDKTVEGEWPWQVAYADNKRTGMSIICGATLINPRTVLTAAHCIAPRRLDKTYLFFGKFHADFTKDDDQVLRRKATEFIVHPRYNRRNMDNDIALVRFAPDVPYNTRIQPVCLPTPETSKQNTEHDAKGWVTGWGATETGAYSDILLMAQLPVVSTVRCRENYKRLNLAVQITNNMYCAGFETGEVDSCTGDSGGPMVFYSRSTETYVLEGIVSFGIKGPTGTCGQENRYGVYTKVSNYVQWIKQYT